MASTIASGDLANICQRLLDEVRDSREDRIRIRATVQAVASRVMELARDSKGSCELVPADLLEQLYHRLKLLDLPSTSHILQCLSALCTATSPCLDVLARLIREQPPEDWQMVGLGLSPLWRTDGSTLTRFFEELDEGYLQPSTLPVLLDLANQAVRSNRITVHPMASRNDALARLLGDVVVRLEKLEKNPSQFGKSVEAVQRVLGDSIALAISLCDALGLIKQSSSVAALEAAMELSHSRIQCEAASALARLRVSRGRQRLIELAADPLARQRAVHYADELGFAEAIDERFRSGHALAESELVGWLASPAQYGVPPSSIEHIDSRTLYWPGYDEPRDCHLFRFQYRFSGGDYFNVGIVGPLTHAFAAPLGDLSINDWYASYAGWHAEHAEIFEILPGALSDEHLATLRHLETVFQRNGFRVESTIALAYTFGTAALVAQLNRDGSTYVGATDVESTIVLPVRNNRLAEIAEIAQSTLRGRTLLRAFNGEW